MRPAVVSLVALIFVLSGCGGGSGDNSGPDGDVQGSRTTVRPGGTTGEDARNTSELRTVTIDASGGERVEVRVEVADDVLEQARGLMYRTALAEDRGMLFVYDDEQRRSFYMKNTLIPLSIAFMDADGRIVDIQDMEPLDDEPPHYVSAEPAQYALEVNQGFFEERGVELGDRADLPV